MRNDLDPLVAHDFHESVTEHAVERPQHSFLANDERDLAAKRSEYTCDLHGNVAATHDGDALGSCLESKETIGGDAELGARYGRNRRTATGGDHHLRRREGLFVDADFTHPDEATTAPHEFDFFIGEITLVDAVETLHVGIACNLQRPPVVTTERKLETIMCGIVRRVGDLRGVPHHFFRYAADVDAGATETRRLDQHDLGTVLHGALRTGKTATATANHDQIKTSSCHGRILHGGGIGCRQLRYPTRMSTLSIATWNVNSLRVRLPQLAEWLAAAKPDVIALQETKSTDADFPAAEISALGYEFARSGQRTYNGVAVLSRQPVTVLATDIPGFSDEQRRVLAVETAGVVVLDLYVPNGQEPGSEKYAYKLRWLEALERWLRDSLLQHRKVIVLGDFNIAPEDRDVHDPKAWEGSVHVSPAEREAYRKLLATGLVDVFRRFEQPEKSFSWWDYRAAAFRRNAGLRIDLILANPSLAERCTSCRIDREPRRAERPSDHTPVIAEFELD